MIGNSIQNLWSDIIVGQNDGILFPLEFLDTAYDRMNTLTMFERELTKGTANPDRLELFI
jgi:hypothetical protein